MATVDFIAEGLVRLEERADELSALIEVLMDVGGDQAPTWVGVMVVHVQRLESALVEHGKHVRERALPVLKDFESVKGGMGRSPMSTLDDPSAQSGARAGPEVSGARSVRVAPAGAGVSR